MFLLFTRRYYINEFLTKNEIFNNFEYLYIISL
nr:MAG TPA: hypothetical protein [Caudoviricetes sp.]